MASRTIFISRVTRRAAFTLVEMMLAIVIAGILFGAMGALAIYTGRVFAAMSNYIDLDTKSRYALDKMTQEIRQADRLVSYATNQLLFSYKGATNLSYTYDAIGQTLTRTNGAQNEILLSGCRSLQFNIYKRNPVGGSFDQFPAGVATNAKLVQVTWTCARSVLGYAINTESMQSAKIVIRKETTR